MDDRLAPISSHERCSTRRTFLAGSASLGVAAIAGCFDDDSDDLPDPVTIDDDQDCDHCTMAIGQHPGPVGQTHYPDPDDIVGEDRPAQFCSSLCTYTFTFEQEDAGHDPDVSYLTDYSSVDYAVEEGEDALEISNHLEDEAFADVEGLTLVVDSDVEGAMGASMIGFTDASEADDFQAEYGGDLYEHEDVTGELVMSLM
jgi:copper chaperone NosL